MQKNCTRKDLHDPDNHDGVITHLELLPHPGMQSQVGLRKHHSEQANGGDRFPVELFQILEDDAMKVLQLNMPANLENSAVTTGLEKVSFHSNPKERQCKRMLKLPHNGIHLTANTVMLKILQARLQQYMNHELLDV